MLLRLGNPTSPRKVRIFGDPSCGKLVLMDRSSEPVASELAADRIEEPTQTLLPRPVADARTHLEALSSTTNL